MNSRSSVGAYTGLLALAAAASACVSPRPHSPATANPRGPRYDVCDVLRSNPFASGPSNAAAGNAIGTLQRDLDAVLCEPALAHGTWGVLVKSLKTGEALYELNARKLLMPASNMKLVILAVAAERL